MGIIGRKARLGAFERVNPRSGIISGEVAALLSLSLFQLGSLRYRATRAVNNRDHLGCSASNLNICQRSYPYLLSFSLSPCRMRLFNQFVDLPCSRILLRPSFRRIIPPQIFISDLAADFSARPPHLEICSHLSFSFFLPLSLFLPPSICLTVGAPLTVVAPARGDDDDIVDPNKTVRQGCAPLLPPHPRERRDVRYRAAASLEHLTSFVPISSATTSPPDLLVSERVRERWSGRNCENHSC